MPIHLTSPIEAMVNGMRAHGFSCKHSAGDVTHPSMPQRSEWTSWVCERSGLRVVLVGDTRGTPQAVHSVHDAEVK